MLLRLQFFQGEFLPGFEWRQFVLELLVFLVLAFFGFFVHPQEAVELHHRSGYAEPEHVGSRFGIDVYCGLIENRGRDLRGDKALPDQLVNLELILL